MKTYSPITEDIKNLIGEAIGFDNISDAQDILDAYSKDASALRHTPDLVVYANSVEDIQNLLRLANQYNFPVIPRGGGSGLAGGCLALNGGVILSIEKLNKIISVDDKNFIMTVEAGAISQSVRDAASAQNLYYPPDPAGMDLSTIGGNAATDAGGPACVKYGTTRDYILGLEAVLPTGELIKAGVQTRKGVVGYDLTNLLIGSEGTLGIITSLTLKLLAKPQATTGFMCVFPDMVSAMNGVSNIMSHGHLPSAIEFMDHKCLGLIGELLPFPLPAGKPSVLIVEIDGPENIIAEEIKVIRTRLTQSGAIDFLIAATEEERKNMWDVRRQVSLRIYDYAKVYYPEDIAVPITRIADLIGAIPEYEERYGIEVFAFGHSGDGNIHLSITAQDTSLEEQAFLGTKALIELSIALGGTISGEHGIGVAKAEFVPLEIEAHNIELQKRIKTVFDPNMILNPGKLFL